MALTVYKTRSFVRTAEVSNHRILSENDNRILYLGTEVSILMCQTCVRLSWFCCPDGFIRMHCRSLTFLPHFQNVGLFIWSVPFHGVEHPSFCLQFAI